ncbi:MAG: hypothetical protein ACRDT6_09490 [Micromonosporaceae bacterium]
MVWQPDYATVAELKSFLRIGDTADDAELALAVAAASRAVDLHTHRQFGQVAAAEERLFTACWDRRPRRWTVELDDVQDLTGLTVTVEGGPITVFTLEPVNAAQKGKPYTGLVVDTDSAVTPTSDEHGVTVTARWGWTAVPAPVKEATLLQASRFHARRDSPYGVAGSPELGSELRLLARVDADVGVALGKFVRSWSAA